MATIFDRLPPCFFLFFSFLLSFFFTESFVAKVVQHNWLFLQAIFISLITRMRYKRDIKMGRLCTPGGAVIGIVGGGVTFRFF